MSNLKRDYNRFVFKHRDKGIPNLMLWICILNALVYVATYFLDINAVSALYFDSNKIMQGQVWRLFTYIFTFAAEASFFGSRMIGAVFSILFYYWAGTLLENTWGTLRFNLFYFCGMLLMAVYSMLNRVIFGFDVVMNSHYLNLSLFLAVATLQPDTWVRIYLFIPVRMKWLSWVYLGLTLYDMVGMLIDIVPLWKFLPPMMIIGSIFMLLLPVVALGNYFLFFGRDVINVFPDWLKRKFQPKPKQKVVYTQPTPSPDWAKNYRNSTGQRAYRHKCTVCGRTDTDCPDLEFRYCSKCAGYFCYCVDHINNHTHVQ